MSGNGNGRDLCPLLYEINTRVWLRQRGVELGRPATLDDIADAELDRLAGLGFRWVWMLGVWRTGAFGRRMSLDRMDWRHEFLDALPDLEEADICGSCFAVAGYDVSPELGGDAALRRLRARLRDRGVRLMLDFVPNHTAFDHPWVRQRPDLYVQGSADDLARAPDDHARVDTEHGPAILARGRDPYFPAWPDVAQLNYGNPATRQAMQETLLAIAELCDGVRCDMAMLILPEVFQRTWGIAAEPFWPDAIRRVRDRHPGFLFMAEVYWDLEWTVQRQGFDCAYDKRLYDRLVTRTARSVRDHLWADLGYQQGLARFLENHDEPRAAAAFPWDVHQAAAVLCYLTPGLRLFHQGQFEGVAKRVPVHLSRAPAAAPDRAVSEFYARLLGVLRQPVFHDGDWRGLEPVEAWPGNGSWDGFVAFQWTGRAGAHWIVVVNYRPDHGQCYLRCPGMAGGRVVLADALGSARYEREGDDLASRGLYLDMPPWGRHVFELTRPAG
ncbi:alpha-amylase family glycosyl hydrolase [Azospirillum sp. TSO22-1]|uniref:alpha-amylase family glycosyl hydrolase n=1 Tax=Azospirillum sp. TSO22-1 TaxID=716789 RepID=UPI000D608766|nr:alpha-amylase family glycosyl hydrolase [Azospirillum sp. TSO22-1]PWC52631.1 alpha-amylase [Azospirillum sp. TSO22-1]